MKKLKFPVKYSQKDPRWGSELLGYNTNTSYNLYNYGCLITCLAMISSYYGQEETPATINNKLKNINGFVSGGLYVWGSFPKISNSEEVKTNTPLPLTDAQIAHIKDNIDNGYPVMVQLDYNPKTVELDMHYVIINGYDGDEFFIVDPIDGTEQSLNRYLGWFRPDIRKTIEQFVVYIGEVIEGQTLEELLKTEVPKKNFEGNIRTVEFYFREWEVEKRQNLILSKDFEETVEGYQNDIKTLENRNGELEGTYLKYKQDTDIVMQDLQEKRIKAEESLSTCETNYEKLNEKYTTARARISTLNSEVKALKEKQLIISDYPISELLKEIVRKLFKINR